MGIVGMLRALVLQHYVAKTSQNVYFRVAVVSQQAMTNSRLNCYHGCLQIVDDIGLKPVPLSAILIVNKTTAT